MKYTLNTKRVITSHSIHISAYLQMSETWNNWGMKLRSP